jgi:hypothetical protein
MKHFLLSMFLLLFGLNITFAQKLISGKITSTNGEALIGANISVKETPTIGTFTDVNGDFQLNLPLSAATLVISYTGI